MIPLIKTSKKFVVKTDLIKMFLGLYCLMNSIKLSNSELTCLSYFIVYGFNQKTQNLILESKIFNHGSLTNTISKFRKYGFIIRDEINPEFNISDSSTLALLIKLDIEKS